MTLTTPLLWTWCPSVAGYGSRHPWMVVSGDSHHLYRMCSPVSVLTSGVSSSVHCLSLLNISIISFVIISNLSFIIVSNFSFIIVSNLSILQATQSKRSCMMINKYGLSDTAVLILCVIAIYNSMSLSALSKTVVGWSSIVVGLLRWTLAFVLG